jgi:hypothetical protein
MPRPTKEGLRTLHRQSGLLGVRYAVYAAGVAAGCVLAASFAGDRLSGALGDWACDLSPRCSAETLVRVPPPAERPTAIPVSAPAERYPSP